MRKLSRLDWITAFLLFCAVLLASLLYLDSGHEWGDDAEAGWTQTKAPTCEAAGEETRTCACGHEETREVAQLEHTATDEWTVIVQAGCDTTGTQIKTCKTRLLKAQFTTSFYQTLNT